MNASHELDCRAARAALSARLDGALEDERDLRAHLEDCEPCHGFEATLSDLSAGWSALRDVTLPPTLESRVLARAARNPPRLVLRLAAGLIGFVGVAGGMTCLERETSEPEPWVESLAPISSAPDAAALFAAVPEYQLLVGFPRTEEGR